MKRYHPVLVTLHWLLALMIVGALGFGLFVLHETPNSDPEKLVLLKMHMIAGLSILALMLIRLVLRHATNRPPAADTGFPLLNRIVTPMHYLLYIAVIVMAGSGLATSKAAGLRDIVFDGSGAPLPKDFHHIAAHEVHETMALVLILLIAGHIAAALYHQFIRKDELFSRMWFGNRD
jgi:cytochrome b561